MNAIAVSCKGQPTTWFTYETEAQRDNAFAIMMETKRHQGCGGECDCFHAGNNYFVHCGGWRYEIVEKLKMVS